MATRSFIGVYDPQDPSIINAIYCHFDGYIDGVGSILDEYYDDPFGSDMLVYNGDLKGIGDKLSTCIPLGDNPDSYKQYVSEQELIEQAKYNGIEYVYLYYDSWKVYSIYNPNLGWRTVRQLIKKVAAV